jgi:damage-control phosphatase, subfamily III
VYEQHPFWCTGYTFWDLHSEAPDLFLHLSRSDLVLFKGDLNHRKLTYDCAAPASTPFEIAIGPMASSAGAPVIASLRTIKSDVVVGLGREGDEAAERLDKTEPGWKISGKYVSFSSLPPFLVCTKANEILGCCTSFRRPAWRESPLRLDFL